MLIFDIIAGLSIGILSGMGIGGGGLLVVYLTVLRNMDQISAQGINLYYFIFASAAALLVHMRKRKINFPLVFYFSLFGMPAAFLGCATAKASAPETVRSAFGGMLIVAGLISLFRQLSALKNAKTNGSKR